MKIEIRGKPEFWMELDLATCQLLRQLSAAHYDARCRAAGNRGGFLYGWENRLTPIEGGDDTPARVTASFGDLDLTLKLCEQARYLGSAEDVQRVLDYRRDVHYALGVSNNVTKDWRFTVS